MTKSMNIHLADDVYDILIAHRDNRHLKNLDDAVESMIMIAHHKTMKKQAKQEIKEMKEDIHND